jgi:8-oxo-dGTP diphosphatase
MVQVVVGIILRENGTEVREVLLCQRSTSARYALKWEFPGGKVEEGEKLHDALRRELREELAIEATIGDLYHRQHYVYPDSGTFDVYYYRVPHFSGPLVNRVFESTEWVPLPRLVEFDILEGNADVVRKLINEYAKSAAERP